MAQISVRIDETVKRQAESTCKDIGMPLSTAINIFLVKLGRERRIPFEVAADPDPFYSAANMKRLRTAAEDIEVGRHMSSHDLIEEDS